MRPILGSDCLSLGCKVINTKRFFWWIIAFSTITLQCAQTNLVERKIVKLNSNESLPHQATNAVIVKENQLLSSPKKGNSEHIEWQSPLDDKNAPCYTNSTKNEIVCLGPGFNDVQLRKWFAAFSKTLSINYSYNPYSISINLRDLVLLESKVFAGISFTTIFLRGNNLTYIDRDAFYGSENSVQSLYIYRTKLSSSEPKYDFFAAVRTLNNLNKLTIASNLLSTIPDR